MKQILLSFILLFLINTKAVAIVGTTTVKKVVPCKDLLKLNNDEFRSAIVNGVGECYGRSYRGARYTCLLYKEGDKPQVNEYDDVSCMNLFGTIKKMIKSGEFEKLCGQCELDTFPLNKPEVSSSPTKPPAKFTRQAFDIKSICSNKNATECLAYEKWHNFHSTRLKISGEEFNKRVELTGMELIGDYWRFEYKVKYANDIIVSAHDRLESQKEKFTDDNWDHFFLLPKLAFEDQKSINDFLDNKYGRKGPLNKIFKKNVIPKIERLSFDVPGRQPRIDGIPHALLEGTSGSGEDCGRYSGQLNLVTKEVSFEWNSPCMIH